MARLPQPTRDEVLAAVRAPALRGHHRVDVRPARALVEQVGVYPQSLNDVVFEVEDARYKADTGGKGSLYGVRESERQSYRVSVAAVKRALAVLVTEGRVVEGTARDLQVRKRGGRGGNAATLYLRADTYATHMTALALRRRSAIRTEGQAAATKALIEAHADEFAALVESHAPHVAVPDLPPSVAEMLGNPDLSE